jgi:tetratricopeptide (TPR) repeat protein
MMLRVGTAILKPMKQYNEMIRILSLRNNTCTDEYTAFSLYSIGTAHYELTNVDSAIANLNKAIEIDSNYHWAHIYLGDIFYSQKNTVEAEKHFSFVVNNAKLDLEKYKNELAAAYSKQAGIKLDAKKYKDLEKVAKEWLDLIPENNEYACLYLAVSYQGSGDAANACKYYREVLKINKDNKTAKDNLKGLGC